MLARGNASAKSGKTSDDESAMNNPIADGAERLTS